MSALMCICRVYNYLKHPQVLHLHKCLSLHNSILSQIQRSRYDYYYTCQTLSINGFSRREQLKFNYSTTTEHYLSYIRNSDNNQYLKTTVNGDPTKGTNNDTNKISIEEKVELIKYDLKRIGRVYKGDIDSLHYSIQKAGSCSNDQGVFLLQCCGKLLPDVHSETRTVLALSVWQTLKQNNDPLTLAHYNALLSSLADNKHNISVKELLLEIQQNKLTLDANFCLSLLRCVCEVGDMEQATQIVKVMLEAGIATDQQMLDCLLLGHGRAGDMKTVESLIGTQTEPSSLTVVLKVSAEAGQMDMFSSYLKKASMLSEVQRLDVTVSLAESHRNQFIPEVLSIGEWSAEGILQGNNTIIQLVHLGYPQAGLIVLTTLAKQTSDNENIFGSSFIEELLKSNAEVKTVIGICNELSKLNPLSLVKATECALLLKQQDVSLQLLTEMIKQGFPVRPHYFWPLIISASETQGKSGILNVLDSMLEMNVKPDFDTLRDYIIPRWNATNLTDVVVELRQHGLSLADIMTPALYYLLFNDRIEEAVELCSTYKTRIDWKLLLNVLAHSFIASGNVKSTIAMLKHADESAPSYLVQVIKSQRRNPVDPQHLKLLLEALKVKDDKLSSDPTQEQDLLVANNGSTNEFPYIPHPRNMNLEELECHLLELKAKRLNTRGVLRKLFQQHCRLGNTQRATEIKKELLDEGFVFSSGMLASLFQLYTSVENIEGAEECLKELQQKYPQFKIDAYKIVDFATALVKKKQYSKALSIFQSRRCEDKSNMEKNCWRLLNAVAENEGVPEIKQIVKILLDNKYSKVSGELLSPLINAHLQRNDLTGAVTEFENCVETYKKTPMLYLLICNLCKHTDHSLLERVLNKGRKLHGPSNVNNMLILALAESNLPSQLTKVLRSPDFIFNSGKLLEKCSYFVGKDNALALENIATSLSNIPTVNVEPFYHLILQICIKHENFDAALKLWSNMQESDVIPSDKFSTDLKSLLDRHKKIVPSKN